MHDEDLSATHRNAAATTSGSVLRRQVLQAGALGLAAVGGVASAAANTQQPPAPETTLGARFAGKVVLITGATSGIGQATAYAFARQGARVFFCGRREELGRANEAEVRAFGGDATFMRADVRSETDVRAFVEGCLTRYGRIDIAFNNAGVEATPAMIFERTVEDWNNVLTTNATGVFLSMKYELPVMLNQGGGIIINNASVSGEVGFAQIAPYSASKHAIVSLTKVAALEVAARNIRVNAIAPGAVDTPMLRRAIDSGFTSVEQITQSYPIGRLTTADEMARAVMWLSSDEASSVVGTTIDVTGGYLTG